MFSLIQYLKLSEPAVLSFVLCASFVCMSLSWTAGSLLICQVLYLALSKPSCCSWAALIGPRVFWAFGSLAHLEKLSLHLVQPCKWQFSATSIYNNCAITLGTCFLDINSHMWSESLQLYTKANCSFSSALWILNASYAAWYSVLVLWILSVQSVFMPFLSACIQHKGWDLPGQRCVSCTPFTERSRHCWGWFISSWSRHLK